MTLKKHLAEKVLKQNCQSDKRGGEESIMTIKDIAKESGYGVGTVSRVLNHAENVSPKARERIMEVVKAKQYQPNTNAKHLKMQAQSGIAIIVRGIQNILFEALLERMQQLIEKNHMTCQIHFIDQDENELSAAKTLISEKNPQGILFLGSNFEQYKRREVESLTLPCVTVTTSSVACDMNNLSSISVDDTAAAKHVMEYLFAKGHREIGLIGWNPELSGPVAARLAGCRLALLHRNMTLDLEKQYAFARFSLRGGYEAAKELIEKYPEMTAIFAMSDLNAIGAVRALKDLGKHVPEDISVIGFDGIEPTEYVVPRLTTVYQNTERIAVRSVEIILQLIKSPTTSIHEIIPFEFRERESVRDISR